ncbi:MAG: hypothetical protein ABIA59_07170 [Candidatus Latescibacterota bacterium]
MPHNGRRGWRFISNEQRESAGQEEIITAIREEHLERRNSLFHGRLFCILAFTIVMIVGCGKDDSAGPGDNGGSIDSIPPAVITDLTVRTISTNSISLMWSSSGDDGKSGTASSYDLRYHTSTINDVTWEQATQVSGLSAPKPAGQFETVIVAGLACSTEYYFAVKTHDEVPNVSGLSNSPGGITRQERIPPMIVMDLAADAISDTEFLLTWTAPGDDGLAGTASQYDIRYSKYYITTAKWITATQVQDETNPKAAGETDSFIVSGLEPAVNYYFVLRTADEVPNWSDMSNCCSAMAFNELLMVSPLSFVSGDVDYLTIVFRAQAGVEIAVKIWGHQPYYQWNVFQEVVGGVYNTDGVQTVQWDLWSDIYNMTVDEDYYQVQLLYEGVTVAAKNFRVTAP